MGEELGVGERALRLHVPELHRFENHIPLDRTDGIPQTKCMVFFGVQVPKGIQFRPNPAEVSEVVRVTSGDFIDVAYGKKRPPKCIAYAETLRAAWKANLLLGDLGWKEVVEVLFQEEYPVDTVTV